MEIQAILPTITVFPVRPVRRGLRSDWRSPWAKSKSFYYSGASDFCLN